MLPELVTLFPPPRLKHLHSSHHVRHACQYLFALLQD